MFNKNSVTMIILAAALMAATSANAREASEGPRGGDRDRTGEVGHRGRGADDLPGHIRHGRGADDLPDAAGGANDDGTPDQGPGDN